MQAMACNFKAEFNLLSSSTESGGRMSTLEDEVRLFPFSSESFRRPQAFGREVSRGQAWTLDPYTIGEIGIMAIKPGITGDFRLYIKEIGVYR